MRTPPFLLLVAALLSATFVASASAQERSRWYRVAGENAFVRGDSSATSAYPVGRVPQDAIVEVVEERFGWARVRPRGEAFAALHGFVPAESAAISPDGRTARITARTPIRAANFAAREDPARSWKEVARLEPGTILEVVETVSSEGRSLHKVRLPEQAEAWINLAFLREATPAEVQAWRQRSAPAADAVVVEGALALLPARPAPAPISAATDLDPATTPAPPARATVDGGAILVDAATIEVLDPADDAAISTVPRRLGAIELEDLERVWERLGAADPPAAAADLGELRERYLGLAASSGASAAVRSRAVLRAEQLRLQAEIQDRLADLRRMQERSVMEVQAIRDVRRALEAQGDYTAVGRLNASAIYDGRRLPMLFRLQEPGEGPTIAYVVPSSAMPLGEYTGQLVGVVGRTRYDEGLRLNLITPERIEILSDSRR